MENEDFLIDPTETVTRIKSIESKIQEESQLAKLELLRLTRSRMRKAEALDDIIDTSLEILKTRLNPEDPNELSEVSTGSLTFIVKEFSKVNSDLLAGILGATKSAKSIGDDAPKNPEFVPPPEKKEQISKEEFNSIKNVVNFLQKVQSTGEFPEIGDQNDPPPAA